MDELRREIDQVLAQNEASHSAMLELINSHEAIAFVGAGLSSNPSLNYPTWENLIRNILFVAANDIAPFQFSNHAKGDLLLMADEIFKHFESKQRIDNFKSILGRKFGARRGLNCSSTHELLVKLPFKGFVTTNYDDCLTSALIDWRAQKGYGHVPGVATDIKLNGDARHTLSGFLRSLSAPFDQNWRRVVHLHGRHEDPSNIILTSSQYYQAYGFRTQDGRPTSEKPRITIHRQLAWALLATRKLVFFGCSMNDPYVMEILRIVAKDLWEAGQPVHFVVLPLDQNSVGSVDEQVRAFKQYGLEVVFFYNCDGTYIKLDHLLEVAFAQQPPPQTSNADNTSASENSNIIPSVQGISDQHAMRIAADAQTPQEESIPDSWLEEVNSVTSKYLKKNEN